MGHIAPLLPKEQAGFRRGKSTVDPVVLLTQNIEDSFEAKKKAGAILVDLTAAYDTVWHRSLTCKLLRLLPGLLSMISRKFAYADDLALLHSSGNWKDLEGNLSKTCLHFQRISRLGG